MAVLTDDALLERIEAFLAATCMKPTPFGIAATGEGGLVKSLRDGRSLSLRQANKVLAFMDAHDANTSAVAAPSSGKSDDFTASESAAA